MGITQCMSQYLYLFSAPNNIKPELTKPAFGFKPELGVA